ncbi:N-acetylglutamate synthase [Pseudoclavibacter endophyticus]|uniref:Amino-acid N-acetyltransferase n=1 Tax=Pseudoclavibacter endophyticus TaxID=1778590 RepID=A0A6H9WKR0_9MICO|nr:amino-acid N-acetyltransferase [Pseudoclavibacter endophyticus]KAB1648349.1 amino-acid N-acetyltransferase [Pseudoclavibacter endophyticus]GGA71876.1 N-acetylglutamate synthase [Pseudoclavibacter endophyticus]
MHGVTIRRAKTADVVAIHGLIQPLVRQNILLRKDLVVLYESVQEFRVAETADGELVACGALHVLWLDLGEIRTIVTSDAVRGKGVGHQMLEHLVDDARELGLKRLFCLTFETDFFRRHGFEAVAEQIVDDQVYAEMRRSPDEGVHEFLDLPWVKPNTLGNTRMVKRLDD